MGRSGTCAEHQHVDVSLRSLRQQPEREGLAAHVARVRSALTLPGSHTLSTPTNQLLLYCIMSMGKASDRRGAYVVPECWVPSIPALPSATSSPPQP